MYLRSKEISQKVLRMLKESKLTRGLGVTLMAMPLVLPIGTVTGADSPVINDVASYEVSQLKSLNIDIVSVADSKVKLEVVKKPEPKPRIIAPVIAIRTGNYLPEPNDAGKRLLVKSAAAAYGIDWKILEAVWQIESGKSWYRSVRSYAGATGPCQFMPGTWRGYAVDGNGDGIKDINYAPDCLFGSAKLLAANGAAVGNNVRALYAYNRSMSYVSKVLAIANSL